MTDLKQQPEQTTPPDNDPLAHLHKMSTTAGLGTTEYVAVNGVAIVALMMGVASSLSLFDPVLLVIPALAIILCIAAFVQIKNSNGTQTGKGLAGLGLVLAIGFMALVGGKFLRDTFANRADEEAINKVIGELYQDLHEGKYDQAYLLFNDKFTSRFDPPTFLGNWKRIVDRGMTGMHSTGRMEFDLSPETGQRTGVEVTVIEMGQNQGRIPFFFAKEPDGTWKISDIPDLFKVQQPTQSGAKQPAR